MRVTLRPGDRYGQLTYVSEAASQPRRRRCTFLCDCGRLTTPLMDNVRRGVTRSCGCARPVRPHFDPWSPARFWSRAEATVEKLPDAPGCWLWMGALNESGYGTIRVHTGPFAGNRLAHRMAYIAVFGALSDEAVLLHRCDVPCCVNPDHLRPGTNGDNAADMCAKGRRRSGAAGFRWMTLGERVAIAEGVRAGQTIGAIARAIGRSRITVGRHVRRLRAQEVA